MATRAAPPVMRVSVGVVTSGRTRSTSPSMSVSVSGSATATSVEVRVRMNGIYSCSGITTIVQ